MPFLFHTADSSKFTVIDNTDIKVKVTNAYTFKAKKNGPNFALKRNLWYCCCCFCCHCYYCRGSSYCYS